MASRARCSVSYLSMLENNKRDPTLSTLTSIAHALQIPVGLLFVLASEQEDLGPIDERITEKLMRTALSSLTKSINTTTHIGGQNG